MTGKYTLLNPKSNDPNIKNVYVKVILKEALALKPQVASQKEGSTGLKKTIKSCYDFIKTHPLGNETYAKTGGGDYAVYKSDSKIGLAQVPAGGFSTVINPVTTSKVTKLFRGTLDEYKTSQTKLKDILTKVNPTNGAIIGLPKLGSFTQKRKTITVHGADGSVTKVKGYVSEEDSYISDCSTKNYTDAEVPSMCACLIQGSKALIKNGIFHLDVKPKNIGYLGNGKVEHFDLDGSANSNNSNWEKSGITATPRRYCQMLCFEFLSTPSPAIN